jgi:hypothetical protein
MTATVNVDFSSLQHFILCSGRTNPSATTYRSRPDDNVSSQARRKATVEKEGLDITYSISHTPFHAGTTRPAAADAEATTAAPAVLSRIACTSFRVNELQSERDHFGAGEARSFWKRGSFRSGSNIGSSRSSAGVSGTP